LVVARQKSTVVFAFALFISLSYAVGGFSFFVLMTDPTPFWGHYATAFLLLPLATVIMVRQFVNYKVVRAGEGKLTISYPVRRTMRAYAPGSIAAWSETTVKTGKQQRYTELSIIFDDESRLDLGSQEYDQYGALVQWLNQKAGRKKRVN